MSAMLILAFFQWWYGPGWADQIKAIQSRVNNLMDMFSVGILLRTLFAPWKQITTVSRGDQSVQIKMRAGVDNTISRLVGFSFRCIILFVASLGIMVAVIGSVLIAIIWPILPSLVLFVIPLGFAL